jgi:hypothetical protein
MESVIIFEWNMQSKKVGSALRPISEVKKTLEAIRGRIQALAASDVVGSTKDHESDSDMETLDLSSLADPYKRDLAAIDKLLSNLRRLELVDWSLSREIVLLLNQFSLKDVKLMDEWMTNPSSPLDSAWARKLASFRNKVQHIGFLSFDDKEFESENMFRTVMHLKDILTRILLKMIGYSAPYHPACWIHREDTDVDWVTEGLSAEDFQYKLNNRGKLR